MEAPRDDANTPNVRSKTQTALPYLSMSPTPLKYARARPRTTINNFTPNHARAHGVQVNASMGGLSACVRDVVVVVGPVDRAALCDADIQVAPR